jgi:hypothetical protein
MQPHLRSVLLPLSVLLLASAAAQGQVPEHCSKVPAGLEKQTEEFFDNLITETRKDFSNIRRNAFLAGLGGASRGGNATEPAAGSAASPAATSGANDNRRMSDSAAGELQSEEERLLTALHARKRAVLLELRVRYCG